MSSRIVETLLVLKVFNCPYKDCNFSSDFSINLSTFDISFSKVEDNPEKVKFSIDKPNFSAACFTLSAF